ncbi:hypothetical protein [Taibaiella koreensis]|uniref:hypothetical protein n=1 Tax=Taibaiella koreensis TaxID=1268548 RepID=UPI00196926B8|nr:hypothetical protein [Taibaiella koreensis]
MVHGSAHDHFGLLSGVIDEFKPGDRAADRLYLVQGAFKIECNGLVYVFAGVICANRKGCTKQRLPKPELEKKLFLYLLPVSESQDRVNNNSLDDRAGRLGLHAFFLFI